jgi:hypothetical protein
MVRGCALWSPSMVPAGSDAVRAIAAPHSGPLRVAGT